MPTFSQTCTQLPSTQSSHKKSHRKSVLPAMVAPLQANTNATSAMGYKTPDWMSAPFRSISLTQLNAKADMLQRRDNKYVVHADVLRKAIKQLSQHFDVLEIDGKRDFTYDTCYFDDADHSGYFDHHQGRRIRCKVRMRKYVDAGLCFVEVKLKHKRGMTIKKRLKHAPDRHGTMDASAREFVETCFQDLYGRAFDRQLQPALEMRYQRVTLVAKQGGERMTIDIGLQFKTQDGACRVEDDLYLVETKSGNANGIADKVLRALHQHPTNSCSKYCVALAALNKVRKYNKFLVALRRLGMLKTRHSASTQALQEQTASHFALPWAAAVSPAMVH